MAQYRQSGSDRYALRGHDLHNGNGASDHVSIGIRAQHKQSRARRSSKGSRISVGAVVLILSLVLTVTVFAYNYISGDSEINTYHARDDDSKDELDFLTNVTRIDKSKVLEFGQGSGVHGGDSRYWERDDRRRDEDYNEEALEHSTMSTRDGSIDKSRVVVKGKNDNEKIFFDNSIKGSGGRGSGLYNEAGRDELKIYEAEYEASLKNVGQSINEHGDRNKLFDDAGFGMHNEEMDADDEYDDGIDSHDARMVEDDDNGHENGDISNVAKSHDSSDSISAGTKDGNIVEEVDESSSVSSSLNSQNSRHVSVVDGRSTRKFSSEKRPESKRKRRHKFSGSSCEMKLLNSTAQLVEPLESRKFARFSLQYTAVEEKRLKMSDAMLSAYDRELYQCKLLRQWRRGPLILLDVESLDRNCGTSCTVYGMHYDGIVDEAAVTWNTLIDSHCKSGHHNKAEELFEAMQNSGCSPFTTTYNIMINSFGEQERWEDVKTLLGKMQISWDGCHSRTWGLHSHAQPWTTSPRRSPCCNTAPEKDPLSMSCNFKEVIHSPDSYINLRQHAAYKASDWKD